MRLLPLVLLTFAACDSGAIDVRKGDVAVTATAVTCTGTWPRDITPCYAPYDDPTPAARVDSVDSGSIAIEIGQHLAAVDGGDSRVWIQLDLDGAGAVTSASATERSTSPDLLGHESTPAASGWVLPVAVSSDGGTNSGQFDIDFGWGTIAGTYDTAQ